MTPLTRWVMLLCLIGAGMAATACTDANRREDWIAQMEEASRSQPPNLELLREGLFSSDWFVAAAAADILGELIKTKQLSASDTEAVATTLRVSLARGGNWWALGWDEQEPEYGGFRSAAVHSLSLLGSEALPTVKIMLENGNVRQQEAACTAIYSMLEEDAIEKEELDDEVVEKIKDLMQNSRSDNVKYGCRDLEKHLE